MIVDILRVAMLAEILKNENAIDYNVMYEISKRKIEVHSNCVHDFQGTICARVTVTNRRIPSDILGHG